MTISLTPTLVSRTIQVIDQLHKLELIGCELSKTHQAVEAACTLQALAADAVRMSAYGVRYHEADEALELPGLAGLGRAINVMLRVLASCEDDAGRGYTAKAAGEITDAMRALYAAAEALVDEMRLEIIGEE